MDKHNLYKLTPNNLGYLNLRHELVTVNNLLYYNSLM
jgi:hypothetical protein